MLKSYQAAILMSQSLVGRTVSKQYLNFYPFLLHRGLFFFEA
jgi:hypothetical protein